MLPVCIMGTLARRVGGAWAFVCGDVNPATTRHRAVGGRISAPYAGQSCHQAGIGRWWQDRRRSWVPRRRAQDP
jgi:hypothetical protein